MIPNAFEPVATLPSRTRWGVYLVLIAVAVGNMTGRLLSVNSVDVVKLEAYRIKDRLDKHREELTGPGVAEEQVNAELADFEAKLRIEARLQRPFLSANDRSRWMTIRSLVEHGKYEIDDIVGQPTWDTIDMVQHVGRDGQKHLYSSKPPLLATILAGEYWLINRTTGATLASHPFEIGRCMLVTANILPLVLMYVLLAALVERFGTTDWGRIFVIACATFGTFLTTFAVVLNNHIIGAVSAAATLYLLVRIVYEGERRWGVVFLAGMMAAFTAANELPALIFTALTGLLMLWKAPRETLLAGVPGVMLVAAAFFGTNYLAHNRIAPPYAFRSDTEKEDNWYIYSYTVNGREVQSYWSNRQGIDKGEQSPVMYAVHCLVGHHGVISLTPVWLLSVFGAFLWMKSGDAARWQLAWFIAIVSLVCIAFFLSRPLVDRNYGGVTSGLRWVFWLAPLWLFVMIPAADRCAQSVKGQAVAATLLSFSVLSVSYPTWNPWTHPWLYNWMAYAGWVR